MKYQSVIGLEIHVELKTQTKMFCDCLNDSDEKHPNLNICPICTAQPGVLPVINEKAVESVLMVGLALNSAIPEYSKFDRKNYFYPDLPKGYQISQYDKPLCIGGYLEVQDEEEDLEFYKSKIKNQKSKIKNKKIRIKRIHLEEDAGRLVHEGPSINSGQPASLVDFNRAGVPLMELVTEPDIRSAQEARSFVEELRLIIKYLDVANADMEKGEMRVEINISLMNTNLNTNNTNNIRKIGGQICEDSRILGTKTEIKNLNSLRAVEGAIGYEIKRQGDLLDKGKKVIQETRGWDENKQISFSQRIKEEANDYRYFPEPDLPPLDLVKYNLEELRLKIPELPDEKRKRFIKQYNLSLKETGILIQNKNVANFFEEAVSEILEFFSKEATPEASNPVRDSSLNGAKEKAIKLCYNFLTTDLFGLMKENTVFDFRTSKMSPHHFAELMYLFNNGKIGSRVAKDVLAEMYTTGAEPLHIINEKGLLQISDDNNLLEIIDQVIAENSKAIIDYQKGKETTLQFLIGKAMAKTRGSANPEKLKELFEKQLTQE